MRNVSDKSRKENQNTHFVLNNGFFFSENHSVFEIMWNNMVQPEKPRITIYEGHLESKERFAIKKYLLIIGKKKNMQVLSHTFTYFST